MNVTALNARGAVPALDSSRIVLPDAARTTIHVARFPRAGTRARVVVLPEPEPLVSWCEGAGVRDAIIGGFFVRPGGTPLGAVHVDGRPLPSAPFTAPWDRLRSCVQIDGERVRLAPRWALGTEPAGDLLQAGPLLVKNRRSRIHEGADPEGFSAGADQFDSDITAGRYPRAALGLTEEAFVALACDGRGADDAGMTLAELAELMRALGCEEAINLDGGGSTSLVVGGRLRNHPREAFGLPIVPGRPVATAIAFEPVSARIPGTAV